MNIKDIDTIRKDFPILSRKIYDKYPLVYLDNGATTQKPLCVLDAMREEYLNVNANVHRGVHYLSQQATDLHEAARERVRSFINAASIREIVFTRGTTESMNLVASSFTEAYMKEGDEVIISTMEHHSNIVPWQLQAQRKGIVVKVIPMTDDGVLDLDAYKDLFTDRTRLVSVTHVSNVLGTVNPVKEIVGIAHQHGVPCMIDGAQSAPHIKIDVQDMDCDFYAFSDTTQGPYSFLYLNGEECYPGDFNRQRSPDGQTESFDLPLATYRPDTASVIVVPIQTVEDETPEITIVELPVPKAPNTGLISH